MSAHAGVANGQTPSSIQSVKSTPSILRILRLRFRRRGCPIHGVDETRARLAEAPGHYLAIIAETIL